VPPTLVITAVAHVPDVDACPTPDSSAPGDVLLLVGRTRPEFAGSHLDLVHGAPEHVGVAPAPDPAAPARYRDLHRAIRAGVVRACHDVSEGGLAVALAEMCIGGRLGAQIGALPDPDLAVALFAESSGRFVVEVAPGDVDRFRELIGEPVLELGTVTAEAVLALPGVDPLPVDALVAAFHRTESEDA
jgi:phosphoribosylformylglycinamidine synthase